MPDWANEEFLTVAEVAAVLRLNQQTIRNWLAEGRLPALRVGRRVRVLRSDLNRLIEANYNTSSTAQPRGPDLHIGQGFWDSPTV